MSEANEEVKEPKAKKEKKELKIPPEVKEATKPKVSKAELKRLKKEAEAVEKRRTLMLKMNELIGKESKKLKVSVSSKDFIEGRQGRNGATPTASLCADLIMGGGFPKQRVTVVSGVSGGGKTTLAQSGIAHQLTTGGMAHYADFEGAADGNWIASGTGVDLSAYEGGKDIPQTFYPLFDFPHGKAFFQYMMRILQGTVESGLNETEGLTHLFMLDSIPALPAEALIENDDSGSKPWVALLLSEFLPQVRAWMRQANTSLVMINQIRNKIRVSEYENPEYEPGGGAPIFYSDVRLRIDGYKPKQVGKLGAADVAHRLVAKDSKIFVPKADGLYLEHNPDGSTDQYVYRQLRTMKNRVFPPMKKTYMRICVSKGGGEGTGIDKVFDTLYFYEEIGRLKWVGPTSLVLDNVKYDYFDLKKQIESSSDLREEALDLLDSGVAFKNYFDRLSNQNLEIGKPDAEISEEAAETATESEE